MSLISPFRYGWEMCRITRCINNKTRAIHHVRELTRIATGELLGENQIPYKATILFGITRSDAEYFRPNHEACPSF